MYSSIFIKSIRINAWKAKLFKDLFMENLRKINDNEAKLYV